MDHNVGGIDRMLRILVGLGLIVATLLHYLSAWGWLGVVPLATGLVGWCPAYLPFGINSCNTNGPLS